MFPNIPMLADGFKSVNRVWKFVRRRIVSNPVAFGAESAQRDVQNALMRYGFELPVTHRLPRQPLNRLLVLSKLGEQQLARVHVPAMRGDEAVDRIQGIGPFEVWRFDIIPTQADEPMRRRDVIGRVGFRWTRRVDYLPGPSPAAGAKDARSREQKERCGCENHCDFCHSDIS